MQKIGLTATFDVTQFMNGLQQYSSGIQRATAETTGAANSVGSLFNKLAASAVLYKATTAFAAFSISALDAAAAVERLEYATTQMSMSIGSTSDEMVAAIQASSKGMLSQADAMKAANTAMIFGIVDSAEEMGQLTEVALTLGNAVGVDASQAINDFTTGLGRQSWRLLDNLGLVIDQERAYRVYSEQLGKTVDALTEEEREVAFVNAALKMGIDKTRELGGIQQNTATDIDQLSTSFQDFKLAYGEVIVAMADSAGTLDATTSIFDELANRAQTYTYVLTEAVPMIHDFNKEQAIMAIEAAKASGAEEDMVKALSENAKAMPALRDAMIEVNANFEEYMDIVLTIAEENPALANALMITEDHFWQLRNALTATITETDSWLRALNDAETTEERYARAALWHATTTETQTAAAKDRTTTVREGIDADKDAATALEEHSQAMLNLRDRVADYITKLGEIQSATLPTMDTSGFAQDRIEEEAGLNEKLVDLAAERADRMHWIDTGAHARTKEENDAAYAYWDEYYDNLEAKLTQSYDDRIGIINQKEEEKRAEIAKAQAEELAKQQQQIEDLKLQAGLAVLESQGMLEQFTGLAGASADQVMQYIKAGIIPVTTEMAAALGGAISGLDQQAQDTQSQQESNRQIISQLASGEIPLLDSATASLGTTTEEAGGVVAGGFGVMQEAAEDTAETYQELLTSFEEVLTGMQDAVEDVDWEDLGGAIVNGIADGITNGTSKAEGAMVSLVESLLIAAKEAAQVESPSKLFRTEIGEALALGVLEGVNSVPRYNQKKVWDDLVRQNLADAYTAMNNLPQFSKKIESNAKWLDFVEGYKRYWTSAWNELAPEMDIGTSMSDVYAQIVERATQLVFADPNVFQPHKDIAVRFANFWPTFLEEQLGGAANMTLAEFTGIEDQRIKALKSAASKLSSLASGFAQQWEQQGRGDAYAYLRSLERERELRQDTAEIDAKIAAERDHIRRTEQSIMDMQRAQQDLQYLQQQFELLEMIREYGLDAQEILGGMTLGLGADPGQLVQALTAATVGMLEAMNQELISQTPAMELPSAASATAITGDTTNNTTVPITLYVNNGMDQVAAEQWITQVVAQALH